MSLPVNIDDYMKYMPLNEDELQDLHLSAIVKARAWLLCLLAALSTLYRQGDG